MAGEDLLEDNEGKHKPLSKGQKIGLVIGLVTIVLVIIQIRKSAAANASTASTTAIDPATGYPSGSPEDQAALLEQQSAGTGSPYGSGSGSGGSGYSGGGGGGGGGYGAQNAASLATLESQFTSLQQEVSGLSTTGASTPNTTGGGGPASVVSPIGSGIINLADTIGVTPGYAPFGVDANGVPLNPYPNTPGGNGIPAAVSTGSSTSTGSISTHASTATVPLSGVGTLTGAARHQQELENAPARAAKAAANAAPYNTAGRPLT